MMRSLSIILILIGAGFMFASVIFSLKMLQSVPSTFLNRWRVLTALMLFFLLGYLTFIVAQLKRLPLPAELVAGVVFLAGAVFVFLIINLTRNTVAKIREGEQLLRTARDQLEIRVEQRTEQLQKTLVDLEREVSARKKATFALENVNAELLQILNCSADGIRVVDKNFIIQRVNSTFVKLAGIPAEKLIGMRCYEVFEHAACRTPDCSLSRILHGAPAVENEKYLLRKDGKVFPCIVTAFPYCSPGGELIGTVEGFRDISLRKQMENRLKEMSITDDLTGLLNRRGFIAVAEKHLQLGERFDQTLYLLYADLDNMKWINDNLGHDAGDLALMEAADVLKNTFRKSDVLGIGRLGGDEFAVLMLSRPVPCCHHPVLQRLEDQIAGRNKNPDRRYQLSISVGVAEYRPESPCSIEEFLSMGDEAMYECKRERKKNSRT
ncbi:MAG: diguanylate cyclase [Deltaproteobacteria bacterium]|nr:diguanylate cyclase [Deltaproteobacteria bacterium]